MIPNITYPIPVYPVDDGKGCFVYPSQFGLQGFMYSTIPRFAHSARSQQVVLYGVKFMLVVLMVVALLLFVLFVHREFGLGPAAVVLALLSISPWPVGYARNLYWVSFLFFAPFIASLYLYPWVRDSKKRLAIYLGVIGGLLFIKFLTGYEYFTTITLSSVVPMVYWELKSSGAIQEAVGVLLRRGTALVAVAVVAFAVSFGLTVASLVNDYGSVGQAFAAIQQRGELRSDAAASFGFSIDNFHNTRPDLYDLINQYIPITHLDDGKGSPLVYLTLLLINYAALPVITFPVPLSGFLPMILESFLLWAVLGVGALWWIRQHRLLPQATVTALAASFVVGLAGILSWGIVARGFVFQHAHITAIVYYLPFMLFAYCVVGVVATQYWRQFSGRRLPGRRITAGRAGA